MRVSITERGHMERERERGHVDALRERKARLLRGVLEGLRGWEVFWVSEAVLLGE